jgi:inosose dehydratase
MSIRLGTNPIAWSNDDLQQLGGATSLETCLREAREAGFESIEMGHKLPREPGRLGEVLAPAGLDLVSGWYSSGLLRRRGRRPAKAEPLRYARMGCEILRRFAAEVGL